MIVSKFMRPKVKNTLNLLKSVKADLNNSYWKSKERYNSTLIKTDRDNWLTITDIS